MGKLQIEIANLESVLSNCRDDHTPEELAEMEEDLAQYTYLNGLWESFKAVPKAGSRILTEFHPTGPDGVPSPTERRFPKGVPVQDVLDWFQTRFCIDVRDDLGYDGPWRDANEKTDESEESHMLYTKEERTALAKLCTELAAAALDEGTDFAQACYKRDLDYPGMANLISDLVVHASGTATAARSDGDGAMPDWMRHLYQRLAEEPQDPVAYNAALLRLQDAMFSIPGFDAYQCLVREFSGTWPSARPGRADDAGHPARVSDGTEVDADFALKTAMAYLSEPTRKNYITTGFTELPAHFSEDIVARLKAVQVHVPDDLDRFREDGLMSIPGANPKMIAEIYAYDVRTGKEKSGIGPV